MSHLTMKANLPQLPSKFQAWEVGSDYEIKKSISHGSFQKAVEAVQISTNKKVIIAKFNGLFDDLHHSAKVLRELILCRKANHPNLLKIIDIIEPTQAKDFNVLYVVFEYMMSNLAQLLKSSPSLETSHVQHLLYHMLATLKYLNSSGVIHGNLRPCAVLINEDCSIKFSGFDSVKTVSEIGKNPLPIASGSVSKTDLKIEKKLIKKSGGGLMRRNLDLGKENYNATTTAQYQAPDLLQLKKTYTPAVDIWSVGCILAELMGMMKDNVSKWANKISLFSGPENISLNDFSGKLEYLKSIFSVVGTPKSEGLESVMENKFEIDAVKQLPFKKAMDFADLFPGSSAEARDLLKKMLEFNPEKRITIDECFYHPFLKTVCKKEMESDDQNPIMLDFEAKGVITEDKMRELFLNEIQYYKKQ